MKAPAITMLLFATLARPRSSVRGFSLATSRIRTKQSPRHGRLSSHLSAANDDRAKKLMEDVLHRVRAVNSMPADVKASLMEFRVDNAKLGLVRPNMAELLCSIDTDSGKVFTVELGDDSKSFLTLTEACGTTYQSRSDSVAVVTDKLKNDNIVTGWRDELYPITNSFYEEPLFAMERAAVPFLGATEYGVHINGLIQEDDGTLKMWIARRSADKSKYPGMLDHIAAGGQPVGLSLTENVIKECFEEAGIPPEISSKGIRPAGAISYERYSPKKDVVEQVVLFCYDLYLPAGFQPKPVDGEVEEFFVYSMEELLESLALDCRDPMKPNCYSVIIDFLLRHGYLSPEVPGYLDVLRELRGGECR